MKRYSQGAVHGRFQPFHKDHLRYCLAAKRRCDFLWVGITQPDVRKLIRSPKDKHRQLAVNNPLSYFERHTIIKASLLDAGLKREDFEVIPFPIDEPDRLVDFLPLSIPIFTTVNDKWNLHKIKVLTESGYKVFILWKSAKKHEGNRIRKLISRGDPAWKAEVPAVARKLLQEMDIESRIRRVRSDSICE